MSAPIRMTADQGKTKTPAEILSIADEIWSKVKSARIDVRNEAARTDMHNSLRSEYVDFAYSFPLVLQWMALLDQYHSETFKKYLRMCKSPPETREKYNERQVAWPVMMYRRNFPHDEVGAKRYRADLLRQYEDEEKAIKEHLEEVEKQVEKEEALAAEERRARVYELLNARVKNMSSDS